MKRPPAHVLTHAKRIEGAIELLYVADAARLLNCSEKAIRRRIERGLLPHRRLGAHRIVMFRSELVELISSLPGVSLDEAKANLRLRNGEAEQR